MKAEFLKKKSKVLAMGCFDDGEVLSDSNICALISCNVRFFSYSFFVIFIVLQMPV